MNKTVKIFAGAAVLASFAACSQKIDFETFDYARLEATSYTFNEDAGTVTIPVYANKGASGTVNFEVIENTAKVGTNFTVEPANGSLNINGGSSAITLKINHLEGVFTGDVNFTIRLTGASDGLTVGGIYAARVTIKDLDHPLLSILGAYTASGYSYFDEDDIDWTMTLYPDEADVHTVWIDNLFGNDGWAIATTRYYGTVNEDQTVLTIPFGQTSKYVYSNGKPILLLGIDEEEEGYDDGTLEVAIVKGSNGKVSLDFGHEYGVWAYIEGAGSVSIILPGITAVKN